MFSATVVSVQIGPQGMPHQPAIKEIIEYGRPLEKALSPGRRKMIGDERLNESTMTETQNWKQTNFPPAATACWRSATLMPCAPEMERRSSRGPGKGGGITGGLDGIMGGGCEFIDQIHGGPANVAVRSEP